jgi:hypothetical protein
MKGGGFVKKYMRIDEVAERFSVTPRTVRNWWLSGHTCLQAWHPGGPVGTKGVRFTAESVEQFEKVGRIAPQDMDV